MVGKISDIYAVYHDPPGERRHDAVIAAHDERQIVDDVIDRDESLAR